MPKIQAPKPNASGWLICGCLAVVILLPPAYAMDDYGDAPVDLSSLDADLNPAYPTTLALNGARHTIGALFLGSAVDVDADGQPTIAADGDDLSGSDDDDGVVFPTLGTESVLRLGASNTIRVTASGAGLLSAWIDLNQDGDWLDANEQFATDVVVSPGINSLFVSPATTVPTGLTYLRFRLSTLGGLAPTGAAADGEVEDYRIRMVLAAGAGNCASVLINSGFETPTRTSVTPLITFADSFTVREAEVEGWAFEAADPTAGASFDWRNAVEFWDGSPSAYEGSQFAEINAETDGLLYQELEVPPGASVTWQVAHRGRDGTDQLSINVGAPGATVAQAVLTTGNTAWQLYSGVYVVPVGQRVTRFEFESVSSSSGDPRRGNFIDDVRLGAVCDFGDAPAAYPVVLASGGAHHILDGSYLGARVDADVDGQPNGSATGDDIDVALDDEDGVSLSSGLPLGSSTNVDVVASSAGFINAWVDFNQDLDWDDSGERVLSDAPVSAGLNSLSIATPATATPGSTFARFRYTPLSGTAITPGGQVGGGEVEDHMVTVGLALVKRAFQVDGTPIADGATLPLGMRVQFLIYLNNPGGSRSDVTLQDVLSATFAYETGTLRIDNTVSACAATSCTTTEEAAIRTSVAATTPLSDAVDLDVASFDGANTVNIGDGAVGNATLNLAGGRVWALLFTVRMQ